MPVSKRTALIAEIKQRLRPTDRFVEMCARLRVYGFPRVDGKPSKLELLPKVYGGTYDRIRRQYIEVKPKQIREITCHAGQLPLLTFDEPGVARVLALGAPGGGKTGAIVRRALLLALIYPNTTGGLVVPTNDRKRFVWDGLLEVAEPFGWVQSVQESKKRIILANNVVIDVLAAARSSTQRGSPLQGRSWDWACIDETQNVDDESQTEIDTRGRRVGTRYVVFETATNAQVPAFRVRLEQYKASPLCRILRYAGKENPWIEDAYWERLKGLMSEREYREKILAEDVPPDMLIYPRFKFTDNVIPRPRGNVRDITERVVWERYNRRGVKYIVAQDFGVLVTCSIILKCYAGATKGERLWWAIDEVTSWTGTTADLHARKILQRYGVDDIIVIADPHFNSKESDKSDYNLFRGEGLDIRPATHGKIPKKHRISMVNALLEDSSGVPNVAGMAESAGVRRLFIDCDDNRNASCKKLVQSFLSMQYNAVGEAEADKKDYRDMSHWTAAVGYGLFPWERIRGGQSIQVLKSAAPRFDGQVF